jgi:hypothetical protein
VRFLFEYKDFKSKEKENQSLRVIELFLNEQLIGKFHGQTFECLLVRFLNRVPPRKKLELKMLYQTIAEIELPGEFENNIKLNLTDFQMGLSKIEKAIQLVYSIPIKTLLDYNGEELMNDYKQALEKAPETQEQLNHYAKNKKEIEYHNQVKRADCLLHYYATHPKPLTKKIVGIRIYDHFSSETLLPYRYIYSELFSNLLRRAEVKLQVIKKSISVSLRIWNKQNRNLPLRNGLNIPILH